MDLHVTLPDWAITPLVFTGCVIAYSLIGALTAAILSRYGFDGKGAPPHEVCGFIWPCTLAIALFVLACIILWWTVFLPARGVYHLIAKKEP